MTFIFVSLDFIAFISLKTFEMKSFLIKTFISAIESLPFKTKIKIIASWKPNSLESFVVNYSFIFRYLSKFQLKQSSGIHYRSPFFISRLIDCLRT